MSSLCSVISSSVSVVLSSVLGSTMSIPWAISASAARYMENPVLPEACKFKMNYMMATSFYLY